MNAGTSVVKHILFFEQPSSLLDFFPRQTKKRKLIKLELNIHRLQLMVFALNHVLIPFWMGLYRKITFCLDAKQDILQTHWGIEVRGFHQQVLVIFANRQQVILVQLFPKQVVEHVLGDEVQPIFENGLQLSEVFPQMLCCVEYIRYVRRKPYYLCPARIPRGFAGGASIIRMSDPPQSGSDMWSQSMKLRKNLLSVKTVLWIGLTDDNPVRGLLIPLRSRNSYCPRSRSGTRTFSACFLWR